MGKGKRVRHLSPERERKYPNLTPWNYTVTSGETTQYNCVAHAVGDTTQKWDCPPFGKHGCYWPPGALRGDKIEALISAFVTIGYVLCDDGKPEPGFEKVALYEDENREWSHAAKQCKDGAWSSKLGTWEDIRHATPEGVECPTYGKVVAYMKRPRVRRGKRHTKNQAM
jgi:hypothetical protein